jgi:hypothetical protein
MSLACRIPERRDPSVTKAGPRPPVGVDAAARSRSARKRRLREPMNPAGVAQPLLRAYVRARAEGQQPRRTVDPLRTIRFWAEGLARESSDLRGFSASRSWRLASICRRLRPLCSRSAPSLGSHLEPARGYDLSGDVPFLSNRSGFPLLQATPWMPLEGLPCSSTQCVPGGQQWSWQHAQPSGQHRKPTSYLDVRLGQQCVPVGQQPEPQH